MKNKKMGTAIILAGGESKRFGYPKELIKFRDVSLLEIIGRKLELLFREIIVVTNHPLATENLNFNFIITEDILKEGRKSSIRGLHAGLTKSSNKDNFVMACDMPFVNLELIKYMYSHLFANDAVVPRIDNYVQPLYAFYDKSCLQHIENKIISGNLKLTGLYSELKVKYIEREEIEKIDPEKKAFFNINDRKDFKKAEKMFPKKKQVQKEENF